MDKRTQNLLNRQMEMFVDKYGILECVQCEKEFAVSLAQDQIQKADEYLKSHPDLPFMKRSEIAKACNELQRHIPHLEKSLSYYALMAGVIECNRNPRKGVDYSLVLNLYPKNQKDLYDQALAVIDTAQETALQAERKSDELINKLATLCGKNGNMVIK